MKSLHRPVVTLLFLTSMLSLVHGSTRRSIDTTTPAEKQLNIVFHGLFSYIFWPDHLEVLAPQVDEHVYKAGTWGKEIRLKESTVYQLSGVHGEKIRPQIDPDNLVLQNIRNIDRNPVKLFCSFILPLPREIHGIRRAHANGPVVVGSSLARIAPAEIPLVQTLVYTISDLHQMKLSDGFVWMPEVNEMGAVNLHVWAEPETELPIVEPMGHAPQAFSHLMALFPGTDLHLEFSAAAPADKSTGIRGLNGWEESSLVERHVLLFPANQRKQKKHKGTEISNCIGVIVLND